MRAGTRATQTRPGPRWRASPAMSRAHAARPHLRAVATAQPHLPRGSRLTCRRQAENVGLQPTWRIEPGGRGRPDAAGAAGVPSAGEADGGGVQSGLLVLLLFVEGDA